MTVEEYVAAVVAKAPPLSERQRERISAVFAAARSAQNRGRRAS